MGGRRQLSEDGCRARGVALGQQCLGAAELGVGAGDLERPGDFGVCERPGNAEIAALAAASSGPDASAASCATARRSRRWPTELITPIRRGPVSFFNAALSAAPASGTGTA